MKKVILTIAAIAAVMTACSGDTAVQSQTDAASTQAEQQESSVGTAAFTDENGVLTYLDTEHSPFDGAGLKITADKAAKTVKFVKTLTAMKQSNTTHLTITATLLRSIIMFL